LKKIKAGRVKHVSSTAPACLPKQEVEEELPEPKMSPAPQPVNGRVVLPANCTIHGARALQAHLLEQLERPGPCEIDGGSVQQVDTAGVQLMLAFALDCLERNLPYAWKSRSAALEEAIRVLNVGALLEYPA
jgi:ABC-type transporter Mla MlaB component